MKKLLICLISVVMICGSIFSAPFAVAGRTYSGNKTTVLITLEESSLLDIYESRPNNYDSFSSFLLSDKGKDSTTAILKAQEICKNQLYSRLSYIDLTDSCSYTALTNAFTAQIELSELSIAQSCPNIRCVSVLSSTANTDDTASKPKKTAASEQNTADSHDNPEQNNVGTDTPKKAYDTYGMASKSSIQISAAYEEGYTGKGMLIAVIDNEFDVHHEVFSAAPKEKRFTKDDIRQLASAADLGISQKYTINDIFYNGKIVFVYDYGENDNNCRGELLPHGTHVAGIAAGNNKGKGTYDYKGTAYDAQLAFFKISDKSGDLKDDAIIAALDNAVKLSPDVINCSYGAIEFLTHDYEGKQIYEKLIRSGTAIVAASGNDAYNGYMMGISEVPVSYMNYSTICSPSSMEGAFSVAASVPEKIYSSPMYMVFNNKNRVKTDIVYSSLLFEDVYDVPEPISSIQPKDISDAQDDIELDRVSYVYIDGKGTLKDFKEKKTSEKIAVLNESDIPLDTIVKNSIKNNCYAVVIIKKEKDSALQQSNESSDFFVYTVDSDNKEYFEKHPKGVVSIRTTQNLDTETPFNAGTVAEYSSYGSRADMTLKPDVTAPGDSILSSVPGNNYSVMSGTSMAAPCSSGAYAIMKQYVKESGKIADLSPYQTEEYIYKLLMSTADILQYNTDKELYYSPRLQGAGCIDLDKAIHTEAYLSVNGERPKVSLKDNTEGTYRFQFTVTNTSDVTQTYTPGYILQTDGYKKAEEPQYGMIYVHTFIPDNIRSKANVTFFTHNEPVDSITVPPHSEQTIDTEIVLDEDYVSQHSKIFTNGFYVDGFIILRAEESPDLSIPFSGYCGDWTNGDIFPKNIYNENAPFPSGNSTLAIVSSFDADSPFSESAGINIFGYNDLPSVIAFGKNSLRSYLNIPREVYVNPCVLLPDIYILRDAMDYTISIYDSDQTLLFCQNFGDISSYFDPTDAPNTSFTSKSKSSILSQYFDFAETLTEGKYTYLISAARVGTDGNPKRRDLMSFKVYVDNTNPTLQSSFLQKTADNRLLLNVEATDNTLLQGIRISAVQLDKDKNVTVKIDLKDDILQYWGSSENFVNYRYDSETGKYYFCYDLTNYKPFIKSKKDEQKEIYKYDDLTIIFENDRDFSSVRNDMLMIEAVDCAYNCSSGELINIDAYGEATVYLYDENGLPLSGIEVMVKGQTYKSDAQGKIVIHNLPMGNSKLKIISDYVTSDERSVVLIPIDKKNYQYEAAMTLKKPCTILPQTSEEEPDRQTSTESSNREKTIIVNFHTGDVPVLPIVFTVTINSALLIFFYSKRKID